MADLPTTIKTLPTIAKDTIDKLDAQPSLDPQMKEAIAKLRPIILRAAEGLNSPEWAHFVKTITNIVNGFSNIPAEFRDKIVGTIESSFFAAAYGLFNAIWSNFALTVEILIMRQLRLTPQEASIVCGGLSFGANIHMLLSLLDTQAAARRAFHFQFSYLSELCRICVYLFRLVQLR